MGEDIFVEVSHGPTLIDYNVLLSDCAMKFATHEVTVVHNLIAGAFKAAERGASSSTLSKTASWYTSYHIPRQKESDGFMAMLHGDMRFYNNIFIQKKVPSAPHKVTDVKMDDKQREGNLIVGTIPYEGYPSFKEYIEQFEEYCEMDFVSSGRYYNSFPVWAEGNVYFNGAKPMSKENAIVDDDH